jgi:hypothetical protein
MAQYGGAAFYKDNADMLAELERDPWYLDPSWLVRCNEAIDRRLAIAGRRFALAGATRQVGGGEAERIKAAVRYGTGEMAFCLLKSTPGFNEKRKPLTTELWNRQVADIANALLDCEDIGIVEVRRYLSGRLKIQRQRSAEMAVFANSG